MEWPTFSQRNMAGFSPIPTPLPYTAMDFTARAPGSPSNNYFSQLLLQLRGVRSSQWVNSRSYVSDLWVRLAG